MSIVQSELKNPIAEPGKPKRILVVCNKCPPDYDGGLEMSAFQIAKALRERGHQVDFATSMYRSTFKRGEPDPDWVHRIFKYVEFEGAREGLMNRLRMKKSFVDRTLVAKRNVAAMREFLQTHRYDLGYCFGLHRISLASAYPFTEQGIPVLWHVGDIYIVDQLKKWVQQSVWNRVSLELIAKKWHEMEKAVDYRSIAFISSHLRDYYVEHGFRPERSYIIPRGVDFNVVEDLAGEKDEPPSFFVASRLHETKGVHHAISAAAMLRDRRPELSWMLNIAGKVVDEEYKARLDKMVEELKLQDNVRFLGMLDRPNTLARFKGATAFLSTSVYEEPFGRTNIEAMGSGAPLVASRTGAIEEIVGESGCALIYERQDPAELSRHMERILDEPELRHELAQRGLDRVKAQYTMKSILEMTERAMDEVIAAGPAQAKL